MNAGLPLRLIAWVLQAGLVVASLATLHRPESARMLVPAYFYPAGAALSDWNQLSHAAGPLRMQVILNPSSGPGSRLDPNYAQVREQLRSAGCTVLGYVHTSWAARDLELVKHDVDTFLELYDVDGFFVDEMSTSASSVPYYTALRDQIRSQGAALAIVGNPGTHTDEAYLLAEAADTFVVFEGPAERFSGYAAPSWAVYHPPHRFAAIIYGAAPGGSWRSLVEECRRLHLGSVFVSDGRGANPYDHLPPYWKELTSRLARAPEPGPIRGQLAQAMSQRPSGRGTDAPAGPSR